MAKKPTAFRGASPFTQGKCFELAWDLSSLSDNILLGTRAEYKQELPRAQVGVNAALNTIRDMRRFREFRQPLSDAGKVLRKAQRTLEKKKLTRKDRMDVFYALSRLHSKVFKEMYTPARVSCGLPRR